ncbi:PadR family transcriptional regulator [Streptomyces profundus]|uniref:PadR family transcriptional regulator n=1 Tax=Streptomyces profundus TaxID=2867410 RepID=UPI001D168C2D|nr:PadR family transcriptional regulator [Streptomyces sp. MA3_2.13]UED84216.1 PadR family transcriptional regulator [Streptomyces sp. MA3_2.13]
MPPVFGHGRLRLYLLKLLAEAPRHGYEVIRLLEERFQGLYAPSAGTVYPRLAKLASEGLVSHTEEGGRKVYSLTPDGQRELANRQHELAALERELGESLAALAAGIREDVSGSAEELREEILRARAGGGPGAEGQGPEGHQDWRRHARWARQGARRARSTAPPASEGPEGPEGGPDGVGREQFEQAARRIQEQVRSRASAGDWPGAVRAGFDGLSGELGGWSRWVEPHAPWPGGWSQPPEDEAPPTAEDAATAREGGEPPADPARALEQLLDRFRDDVRDAARDHGVSQEQLREARRHLSVASAHLVAMLRSPRP